MQLGVDTQRPGALERAGLTLGDWHHALGQLADVEQRMTGILDQLQLASLVTSIPGLSAVGAAVILAETGTGDPCRFDTARAVVKHAGLCPRANESGAFAGTTRISGRGRPAPRPAAGSLAGRLGLWGALHANPVLAARHAHLTTRDHNQLNDTQAHPSPPKPAPRSPRPCSCGCGSWSPSASPGRPPSPPASSTPAPPSR